MGGTRENRGVSREDDRTRFDTILKGKQRSRDTSRMRYATTSLLGWLVLFFWTRNAVLGKILFKIMYENRLAHCKSH